MRRLPPPPNRYNPIQRTDLYRATAGLVEDPINIDLMIEEMHAAEQQHDYTRKAFVGWCSIPLRSVDGEMGENASGATGKHALVDPSVFEDTLIMDVCPYTRQLIQRVAGTGTGVLKVRLMKLKAGAEIAEHRDWFNAGGAPAQVVRLHIPLVTHPKVMFRVNGKAYHMDRGELYVIDVYQRHAVVNHSRDVDRVHLVFDVCRTPEVEKRLANAF